jgi:spore coat protein CotH
MEISDNDLELLDPPTDDRVPVVLTVDGETADGAGVRLKQGFAQFQGLDGKPGFSIETDEFVDGLELFDVDRFTLGNAAWDHSFIAEQLVYEVYRAAGIPAARTALARVTVNGETFGLYVMRETYDERWLEQYFADPTGNLYEAPGGGPDTELEPRTNKRRNDTSDLAAVADVVATASDEDFRDAIEELVDVDQLLTYWAIEALTAHWDGYVFDISAPERIPPPPGPPGNPWPNNFYAYHDPETDKFVFIPHGADVAFGLGPGINDDLAPSTQVLIPPKGEATIARRLWADPTFRNELAERIRWVLDEVWNVQALSERADLLANLLREDGLTGSREFVTISQFEDALADRKDFLTRRGDAVRAELANWDAENG